MFKTLTGTPKGSKKLSRQDITLTTTTTTKTTTTTGIMILKFLKCGCPRSRNTAAGGQYGSGSLREHLFTTTVRVSLHLSELIIVIEIQARNQGTSLPDEH